MGINNIQVCKLPYQNYVFVHGVRNGRDVWLNKNGRWTSEEGSPDNQLELSGGAYLKVIEWYSSIDLCDALEKYGQL